MDTLQVIADTTIRVTESTFTDRLIGHMDTTTFLLLCFWAGVGVLLRLAINAMTRNPLKDPSPTVWSWDYFFSKNFGKAVGSFIATIICLVIAIRFAPEILGSPLTEVGALILGGGFQHTIEIITKFISKDAQ